MKTLKTIQSEHGIIVRNIRPSIKSVKRSIQADASVGDSGPQTRRAVTVLHE